MQGTPSLIARTKNPITRVNIFGKYNHAPYIWYVWGYKVIHQGLVMRLCSRAVARIYFHPTLRNSRAVSVLTHSSGAPLLNSSPQPITHRLRLAFLGVPCRGGMSCSLVSLCSALADTAPRSNPFLSAKKTTLTGGFFGGEKGIRTLDTLSTYTRFPVARLRPAQPSLHAILLGFLRFSPQACLL